MATILILALWLLRRELFFSVLRTGGLLQEMKVFLVANLFLSQRFLSVYLDSRPGCVSLFALSPGCGCLKFLGLCGLWFHTCSAFLQKVLNLLGLFKHYYFCPCNITPMYQYIYHSKSVELNLVDTFLLFTS